MATTVKVVYEDGVFKPKEPVSLPEHAEAEVTIPTPVESDSDDPTGWKAAERFIGLWKDAPARSSTSLSEDHDQSIYRRP